MALVSSTDFESLPVEPVARWLKLRDLLERRLASATDPMRGVSDDDLVEYCDVLVSAAQELKLGNFTTYSIGDIRQHYAGLRSEIIRLATKLSIKSSTSNAAYSVALPRQSKVKIFSQIDRLRALIMASDLTENQKKALLNKLDELHSLVREPRTDFARMMQIISFLALGLAGTTAFLADAPDALSTIAAVIGEAKENEEEELLLMKEQEEPLQLRDLRTSSETDDQIPF
jgi:uncharacterized small protein (DUF1192 family)